MAGFPKLLCKDVELIVSIIIPFSKCAELNDLLELLESVERQSCSKVEVLIVCEDVSLVEKVGNLAKVFVVPAKGSSYARNYGARCSSGDVLGFADDDVILDEQWCEKVIETFADPSVGAVSGRAYVGVKGMNLDWVPSSLMWILGGSYWDYSEPKDVYTATGMNFCIRKDLFFTAGCYDESLGPKGDRPERGNWRRVGAEESDLALRILAKTGCRVLYNPEIKVVHRLRAESLQPKGLIRRALHVGHNRAYIDNKFSYKMRRRSDHFVMVNTATTLLKSMVSKSAGPIFLWKRFSFAAVVALSVMVGYFIGKIEFRGIIRE